MIRFVTGNLLKAEVEALVNTVNTVGVMGKGIALQFKETFQENYKLYKKAAEQDLLKTGEVFLVPTNRMDGVKWIVNFPTKKHWRQPSKIEYVADGLDDLVQKIEQHNIRSIAMPPLGCGNGGLDWAIVKDIIIKKLHNLTDVDIHVYEPSEIAYADQTKKQKEKPRLTLTRALILYLMKSYAQLEYSLTVLETQKLVYLLKRLGDEKLAEIQFEKNQYGPYAKVLSHVLYDIDGYYISGMKFKDAKTFDSLTVLDTYYKEVDEFITMHATDSQKRRIEILLALIEGFETSLSMELLATVDYVMLNEAKNKLDVGEVTSLVQSWNDRKKEIMSPEFIQVAHTRLLQFSQALYQ
jgi:O-acetyl-ADP-ribose deacetylase (regulator of RNase III)